MLKQLRKNKAINRWVRRIILSFKSWHDYLSARWTISGVVKLQVADARFKMYSNCDDGLVRMIYYKSPYVEQNDLNVFLSFCRTESVIFDIGANTGLYSLSSASIHDQARIFSFEPNPVNLNRLRYNIQLNPFTNLEVAPFAVGDQSTEIEFHVLKDDKLSDTSSAVKDFSHSSYRGEKEWKSIKVKQVTIDEYVKDQSLDRLDLLKIDVEGYEINVIEGGMESFKRFKPIIMLESFLDKEKRAYFNDLAKALNYTIYFISEHGIIRSNGEIDNFPGLNFLLMPPDYKESFIPLSDLKSQE